MVSPVFAGWRVWDKLFMGTQPHLPLHLSSRLYVVSVDIKAQKYMVFMDSKPKQTNICYLGVSCVLVYLCFTDVK